MWLQVIYGVAAFAAGYGVGAAPVAWLLVRHRQGIDMRSRGIGGTGTMNALAVGGPEAAVLALALEVAKGALVGVAAWLLWHNGWFIATAIAGCVAGDAYPLGLRRGGRGLVPLVAGLLVALPVAGLLTALVALPATMLTAARGRVYEVVVAVSVPAGLLLGTRQWQSLAPAAVIVAVLLARAAQRRQRREATITRRPGWRVVVDAGPPRTAAGAGAGQNGAPWDSSSPTG